MVADLAADRWRGFAGIIVTVQRATASYRAYNCLQNAEMDMQNTHKKPPLFLCIDFYKKCLHEPLRYFPCVKDENE